MPYFSFILNKNNTFKEFKLNIKYFSKDTKLWSALNKINKKNNTIIIKKEERFFAKKNYQSIIFCLPPNIGLGDSIEYALAIKSIILKYPNKKIAVAHVGRFKEIFENQFEMTNIFNYITEDELCLYDTIFHFTLEIKGLAFQKYDRHNIEKLITDHFRTNLFRNNLLDIRSKKINTISIFPLSQSPLRSLPIYILNSIIDYFIDNFKIEIYLDRNSSVADYIYEKIKFKNELTFIYPKNLNVLINKIKNIEFGIFPDSGPLHVAKILNKKGILIVSSVNNKILLNKFSTIKSITSNYSSEYCDGPCGLVNVFEYNNNYGCYDILSVKKEEIIKMKDKRRLQRGQLKNNYLNLYINSINCYKRYNLKYINNFIKDNLGL